MFLEKKQVFFIKNIFFIFIILIQIYYLHYKLHNNKHTLLIQNIKQNIHTQKLKIKKLTKEKNAYIHKLNSLKTNTFFYEKNAYNKYKYVQPDDIIFHIKL